MGTAETIEDRVKAAVRKVRGRINRIRERGEHIGEQNTKAALIDPLLAALGWNLEELDEVSREYRRKPQDNPVDYALFIVRSPCLFVEAKAFGRDLTDRKWVGQLLGYATVVGVRWCVLTNGDEYRLYNAHAPVDVDEKLFRSVSVGEPEDAAELLDTLMLLSREKMQEKELDVLWRAHFVDRQVKAALREIFDSQDGGLVRLVRKRTRELKPSDVRESLARADVRIDFPVVVPLSPPPPPPPPPVRVTLRDLIEAGIVEPPLTLEKQYHGVDVQATVLADGKIQYGGKGHDSPSAAGAAAKRKVRNLRGDKGPATLGWDFWSCRDPETGELVKLDVLRQRFLRSGTHGRKETPPRARVAVKGRRQPVKVGLYDKGTWVKLSDLIETGVLQAPLGLQATYKGVNLTAKVLPEGKVEYRGESYGSPSGAGSAAKCDVRGLPRAKGIATVGWDFWRYRDEQTGELTKLDVLRQRYLKAVAKQ
jgi:hypothetical protein